MKKNKNFILTALTSFILISCVLFVFCVYNRSNNAKAVSDTDIEADTDETDIEADTDEETEEENTDITTDYNSDDDTDEYTDDEELRGVWISFFDYNSKGYTRESFTKQIENMFAQCKKDKFNTVFVHVRMFSDAMYNSEYFPWSQYASGKIGKSPGFDPLSIMVSEAHNTGLKIHAWINPYRITKDTTSNSALAKSSYAYKWRNSNSPSLRRNVLNYGGQLYFNPAKSTVQNLITNGVKEIVNNYNVDGIHFDDYFYPYLGADYRKNFDAPEYNSYVKKCKRNGEDAMSIVAWRRNNVSTLIKKVYSAIKKADDNCIFGISPAGNIDNLYLINNYYCDVKKWMKNTGYIDYICPQIYWSFKHPSCPFKKTLNEWTDITRDDSVKLYIGLAAYRAGISKKEASSIGDKSWANSNTILKREIIYARDTEEVDGFIFFDYSDLKRSSARKEINNAVKLFK